MCVCNTMTKSTRPQRSLKSRPRSRSRSLRRSRSQSFRVPMRLRRNSGLHKGMRPRVHRVRNYRSAPMRGKTLLEQIWADFDEGNNLSTKTTDAEFAAWILHNIRGEEDVSDETRQRLQNIKARQAVPNDLNAFRDVFVLFRNGKLKTLEKASKCYKTTHLPHLRRKSPVTDFVKAWLPRKPKSTQ